MMDNNISNVRLPDKFWEQSKNEEELKRHILQYMKNYPGYTIFEGKR